MINLGFSCIFASVEWSFKNHPKFAKPKDENGYFESMSKIVFSTGLNWNIVDKKWPAIKKGFKNFDVKKVAKFSDEDVYKLVNDPGMIRSGGKINAIIKNANAIEGVEKEFGSMRKYFSDLKKQGLQVLLKDLKKRFSYMGESTSVMFLFGVGEETPELLKIIEKSHNK